MTRLGLLLTVLLVLAEPAVAKPKRADLQVTTLQPVAPTLQARRHVRPWPGRCATPVASSAPKSVLRAYLGTVRLTGTVATPKLKPRKRKGCARR